MVRESIWSAKAAIPSTTTFSTSCRSFAKLYLASYMDRVCKASTRVSVALNLIK